MSDINLTKSNDIVGELCLISIFESNRVAFINNFEKGAYELCYHDEYGAMQRTRCMRVKLFSEGVPEYLQAEAEKLENVITEIKWGCYNV